MHRLVTLTLLASAVFAASKEVVYKTTPQGELRAHIYLPEGWSAADKRPAILLFFGGGFTGGNPSQFFSKAEYLAKRGMVAISAEYRILTKHKTTPESAIEDCRSAVTWLRAHATDWGVDPRKVAAGGGSAGGTCAAATVYGPDKSARPDALVMFNPAMEVSAERLGPRFKQAGVPLREGVAELLSPAHHVKRAGPPSIQFFGTDDDLLAGARKFVAETRAKGGRAELYTAKGEKHGFFNERPNQTKWHLATLRKADEFLASIGYLKGAPTIEAPPDAVLDQQ